MEEKTNAPLILVGTPCYGGQVSTEYFFGALESSLPKWSEHYRIGFLTQEGGSLIPKARDFMTMTFYLKTNADYLLFIDSDQGFHPEDIVALLEVIQAGYDIAAAPVPKKHLDARPALVAALECFTNGFPPDDNLLAGGYEYNLVLSNPDDKSKIREVNSIGTGMMLISRNVIKRMLKSEINSEQQYLFEDKFNVERFVPSLFSTVFWDGRYLGEDFAFCHRARKAGLKIGMDTTLKIAHKGNYLFEGDYLAFERVKRILKENDSENHDENGHEKTT